MSTRSRRAKDGLRNSADRDASRFPSAARKMTEDPQGDPMLPGRPRRQAATSQPPRTVVVTGAGVLCHLGDDLAQIEAALREGRGLPFIRHPPAVAAGSRCQLLGSYRGDLAAERRQARFMGRAALMGYKAGLAALAQSRLERRDIAVVAGSGTGDVATHVEVQRHLDRPAGPHISATVIPRMMASTVSANLAT